ncbi:phosphoribosyltransferase [soil metagenome]
MAFKNRSDAGKKLADILTQSAKYGADALVLGLPRGGVPVAFEVAKVLKAPLDVFIVRKLGMPGHEELAMGAIASGGVRVLNPHVIRSHGIAEADIERVVQREGRELERREQLYRGDRLFPDVEARTVILVDDGLATGASMRTAVAALKQRHPGEIIVAVPTAAPETCAEFQAEVDEVICAETPQPFYGVGMWYDSFPQTTDEEVHELLERSRASRTA